MTTRSSCLGWAAALIAAGVVATAHAATASTTVTKCTTAQVAEPPPAIVTMTLGDANTGRPVVGAVIGWSFSGHTMTGSSDGKGRFAFQLPVANPTAGERVSLTLARNGYAAAVDQVTVCPGKNQPLALKLTPTTRFGAVKGHVTDPNTGQGVAGVNVAITIDEFLQQGLSATTGSDGSY